MTAVKIEILSDSHFQAFDPVLNVADKLKNFSLVFQMLHQSRRIDRIVDMLRYRTRVDRRTGVSNEPWKQTFNSTFQLGK